MRPHQVDAGRWVLREVEDEPPPRSEEETLLELDALREAGTELLRLLGEPVGDDVAAALREATRLRLSAPDLPPHVLRRAGILQEIARGLLADPRGTIDRNDPRGRIYLLAREIDEARCRAELAAVPSPPSALPANVAEMEERIAAEVRRALATFARAAPALTSEGPPVDF